VESDSWWWKVLLGWLLGLFSWFLGLLTKELSERLTLWIRGPKLILEFTNTEDCETLTPEVYSNVAAGQTCQQIVFFARIRVTNLKPRIAMKCQGWLVKVEKGDEQGGFEPTIFKDSIPLIWSYNAEAESVDIAHGVNLYLDLVRIQKDVLGFQPQLRKYSGEFLDVLRYRPLFQ
jgi:hypothetical protein